jgi:NADH:ubiquinone oxidoreductase subunit K
MNYPEVPVPIHFYIMLATFLFCIGVYGVLADEMR